MNLIIPSIIPRALCLSVDTALYERSAAQGRLVCNGFYFIIKKITRAVGKLGVQPPQEIMGRLPKPLPFLSTPVLSLTGHALFARSNGESPVSSFFLRQEAARK